MWGLTLIPVWLWTGPDWVYPAVNTGWLALLAVAVHALSYWRRDRQALTAQTALTQQQAARAEQQRERAERQRERNAVLEERARIAREMHDVVAHHMSMIAVQAETAPYRVPDLTEPAQKEFAAVSEAARDALTEMRRLLGVLRSDSTTSDNSKKSDERAGSAELAPQPRLEDVPELVETARRAGARVALDMPDSARLVPPGVGLAAYRIVQESLSNAARHAPGARISVLIETEPSFVRVSVTNDPPVGTPPEADGTGHGLAGMQERAALLGGELSAGPESGGGFAVRALLPAGEGRRPSHGVPQASERRVP
jgi:signal transduction histidine kinase